MRVIKRYTKSVVMSLLASAIVSASVFNNATADDEAKVYAFPDKWMVRLGAYIIDGANTTVSVNSADGVLRIHPIAADFFDGGYRGDIRINAAGDVPSISARASAGPGVRGAGSHRCRRYAPSRNLPDSPRSAGRREAG